VREGLPEGHLAWLVIDAVEAMDLSAFYAAYRHDGHGRAAYEPAMMVALLLYAHARGVRSSRHSYGDVARSAAGHELEPIPASATCDASQDPSTSRPS
jgi:transposase